MLKCIRLTKPESSSIGPVFFYILIGLVSTQAKPHTVASTSHPYKKPACLSMSGHVYKYCRLPNENIELMSRFL